jgi:hypothetical protein
LVPAKDDCQLNLDACPGCNFAPEIASASLSIVAADIVLFICPSCGLTKEENPIEAGRKLRARIAELDRLLMWLSLDPLT